MKNYLSGKSIIITGAGSGFGRLVSQKAAAMGANVICVDINEAGLSESVEHIPAEQHLIIKADVTSSLDMAQVAAKTLDRFGQIDVILNNAGIMPLALFSDHAIALEKWHQCLDVNIKGVLNGIACVYDHMMERGEGHIINMSSIFGNYPVDGSNVYGATKVAVDFLSESLRVETHGKIKVTIIKPTGVLSTGIGSHIINSEAARGVAGHNGESHRQRMEAYLSGEIEADYTNPEKSQYMNLDPAYVADQIINTMNMPQGVSLGSVTIRATGDAYIL